MNSLTTTVARHLRRALAPPLLALTLALLALVMGAGSVAAHVGIQPAEAPPGTSQTFTVRVPTERDVPTVRVRMEFPNGMTVSRFQPKPGWQREIERDTSGRITGVVWSGGKIEPAEYEDFFFIARTPQETGKLAFKAYQTYEGGETVEWVNDAEPRPAPAMTIRAAAPSTTTNPSIENPGQAPAAAAPRGRRGYRPRHHARRGDRPRARRSPAPSRRRPRRRTGAPTCPSSRPWWRWPWPSWPRPWPRSPSVGGGRRLRRPRPPRPPEPTRRLFPHRSL